MGCSSSSDEPTDVYCPKCGKCLRSDCLPGHLQSMCPMRDESEEKGTWEQLEEKMRGMLASGTPEVVVKRRFVNDGWPGDKIADFLDAYFERKGDLVVLDVQAPPHWSSLKPLDEFYQVVSVQVPPGTAPGSQVQVVSPEGNEVFAAIPADVTPEQLAAGTEFQVTLPASPDRIFHLLDNTAVQMVQSLFDQTFRNIKTVDRKVRGGDTRVPSEFKVHRVRRIHNLKIWKAYISRRGLVAERLANLALDNNTELGLTDLKTSIGGIDALMPERDSSVGEALLFHGTSKEGAGYIAKEDFSLIHAWDGLFGKGIYCAESVSKSDEYVEAEWNDYLKAEVCTMLLCRVTLGRFMRCEDRNPDKRGLEIACGMQSMIKIPDGIESGMSFEVGLPGSRVQIVCPEGKVAGDEIRANPPVLYDSVLGDREKTSGTFREFIVYDDDHVYPELVVEYERIYQAPDRV